MAIQIPTADEIRAIVREELRAAMAGLAPATHPDEFLSTEDAARELSVTPATITEWIRSGRLRAGRPGRHYVIARSDLLACARPARSAVDPVAEARRIAASIRR